MRFAGVVGALCGNQSWSSLNRYPSANGTPGYIFGFFFNEWIFNSRRTCWRTEYRLHGVWFAIASMTCGLLTYGLTLNFGKHWIGLAFGWVMLNAGMITSTVYVMFNYPEI